MARQLGELVRRAAAVGCVAVLTGVVTPSTAFADDKVYQTSDLAYTCDYPLVGSGALTARARAVGPDSLPSGGSATARNVEIIANVPSEVAKELYDVGGVDGIRGRIDIVLSATGGTLDADTLMDVLLPEQYYSGMGEFPVRAVQDDQTFVPTATAGPAPGPLTISLDDSLEVDADFHFLNASPEWQKQGRFPCALNSGQDPVWGSIAIN